MTAPVVWVPAMQYTAGTGSPSLSSSASRHPVWVLDAASTENVRGSTIIPADWAYARVELVWSNGGGGSGDCVHQVALGPVTPGTALADTFATNSAAVAAPAAGTPATTVIVARQAVTPGVNHIRIQRQATDGADTLANDSAVYGVLLTKVP